MIQRIQSVYLFLAFALGVLLLFLPFSEILLADGIVVKLYSSGLKSFGENPVILYRTIPLTIIISAIVFISFVSIFLYKKRLLQLRLCVFNMLFTAGMILLLIFYIMVIKRNLDIRATTYSLSTILPFIMLLLFWQAFRGINKDEFLVSSADRLR